MRWIELARCIFDSLMVLWFFRPLKSKRHFSAVQKVLCFLILFCAAPIYPTAGGGTGMTLFRFVLRAAVFSAWVYARKGRGLKASVYYGLLCWIAFTTENNIFLTPQLSFLRWNRIGFSHIVFVNQLISLAIELIAEFLILTAICRSFPFDDEAPAWRFRFIAAGVVIVCQLYVKDSLKAISGAMPEQYRSELTFFPIILQIVLTTALILLERHLYSRRRFEEARLDEVASRYRFETSKARAQADLDIRQLHHDMKNHLLGIQRLSGDNEKLDAYVSQLLSRTEDYELIVDSGNSMIDGLLSEKQRLAEERQIAVSVAVDLKSAGFISDMDLCTIFGNALDNAIEASLKVQDVSLRSIMVRCLERGGNIVLTVQNYYEGELRKADGAIATSKAEPGHGLGLSSIRRAAEKYDGIMTTKTDEYHNFILTILVPIP
ncbi:MAG: GHKL domain-containing protein [Firmicutes bacterium]|nr:GHKL domain-containing protein [Bacillota bacterium]